jgi:hypothetical protein
MNGMPACNVERVQGWSAEQKRGCSENNAERGPCEIQDRTKNKTRPPCNIQCCFETSISLLKHLGSTIIVLFSSE